jgi:hypothetical protein
LNPRPTTNRRPRARQDEVALAWAAAAIDPLIKHGLRADEAARRVVREMKRRKISLRRQHSASETTPEESLLDYKKTIRRRHKDVVRAYSTAKEIISSKEPKEALRIVFDAIGPLASKVS